LKTKTTNLLSALHTTTQTHNNRLNSNHTNLKFDTDSYLIGIDNYASASMANSETDFINPPIEVNLKIKGINGNLHTTKVGTVRWMIQDDNGCTHRFDIPGTYLVPDLPIRLLSPQHVAKEMMKRDNQPDSMTCITYADRVLLSWHHGTYKCTIPLGNNNVPILRTSPSYNSLKYNEAHNWKEETLKAYRVDIDLVQTPDELPELQPAPINELFETKPISQEHEDNLMLWHIKLGHLPFKRLQSMAQKGDLPKSLAKFTPPTCQACLYGRATRIPWKVKGSSNHIQPTTKPGQCVSINQMESSSPGIIAQLKGIPTIKRYKHVIIFVDHYTRYTFCYLQQSTSFAEILQAKHEF
jgi:GAG-pre-integrase domain